MTGDRKSIGEALNGIMGRRPAAAAAARGASLQPKSRQGRLGLLTYHDPATIRQLQELKLDHNASQQKLVTEALNLLFVKYGKPPIA